MTFQRAPPDVNGFAVTTCTPGLIRSSQVLMCFGLPLRSTKTTTDFVTKPFDAFLFQFLATRPALTRLSMSGCSEKSTTSAERPVWTALSCTSGAPSDCWKSTPWPAGVAWNAEISFENATVGVEYATRDSVVPLRAPAGGNAGAGPDTRRA